MVHTYTVEKYLDHRKSPFWRVLRDGQLPADNDYGMLLIDRKRDAVAKAEQCRKHDEWIDKLFDQDASGIYVWTETEEKQIAEYAEQLKSNSSRWTFWGRLPVVELGRGQHLKDREKLTKEWTDTARYHAETRRVMAAREEAYRRAGLTLEIAA